jgi:hypothetical protein
MTHWYVGWDTVQNSWPANDIIGHGPIGTKPKPFAVGADVVLPSAAIRADATHPRCRFRYYPFAHGEFGYTCTNGGNYSREFMAEDAWSGHLMIVTLPHMDVGATHPYGADLHQYLTCFWRRHCDFFDLGPLTWATINEPLHRCTAHSDVPFVGKKWSVGRL